MYQHVALKSTSYIPASFSSVDCVLPCCLYAVAGILQVWNVSQQQPLRSLKVGNAPAQSLSFFPGSSRVLITFHDGMVSSIALSCWHSADADST